MANILEMRAINTSLITPKKVAVGDWIDVRASSIEHDGNIYCLEDYHDKGWLPPCNEPFKINLGFSLKMTEGYEGWLLPRSSSFKTWGFITTNSMGIIDNSYCGNDDELGLCCYCLKPNQPIRFMDRVGQFRIMPSQGEVVIIEVLQQSAKTNRGGFGSTGTK